VLIDRKIDVKIWKSEGAMGRNGKRVVPRSYSMEFFESHNFTMRFFYLKPYNEYGIGFEERLND